MAMLAVHGSQRIYISNDIDKSHTICNLCLPSDGSTYVTLLQLIDHIAVITASN